MLIRRYRICKIMMALVLLGLFAIGTAGADDYDELRYYAEQIKENLPAGWWVVKKETGVIPSGHYDGLKYEGSGGISLYLAGTEVIDYNWKDQEGTWNGEPILKEAIILWIMPSDYRQSWKRFFVMKSQVSASQIYGSRYMRLYGEEVSYWPPEASDRFRDILPHIAAYGGSPRGTVVSWVAWREDVTRVVQKTPPSVRP